MANPIDLADPIGTAYPVATANPVGTDGVAIRPMRAEDVAVAEQISDQAFHVLDLRQHRPDRPEPQSRSAEQSARWIARTARFLDTDPGGCWVAEDETGVLGFATSVVREQVWVLVTFAVRPGLQGRGLGARLLAAATAYGAGCPRAMLSASDDPAALRRYWSAGFALHPQLLLHGPLDRSLLPAVPGLRDGTSEDLAWIDDLDRLHRGGPHGPDHESLLGMGRLVVAADRTGYAYAGPTGPALLAARSEETACSLLWECLASVSGEVELGHVTAANRWAVDLGMRARLSLATAGFLGVRGLEPPTPYLHNGALL